MSSNSVRDIRTIAQEWADEVEAGDGLSVDYAELCNELGVEVTPEALEEFGESLEPTLIAEGYFEEYAQELAEDVGAIDRDAKWPMNCIDWEHAARELAYDYTTVSFDGESYYIRSW